MPECFNCCFWARATVLSCYCTEIGNVANAVSTCAAQPQQTKQRQLFPIKWTIAEQSQTCLVDEMSAKSGEMVSGCRRPPRFPPKRNYYFLAHLQCTSKAACKFIPWYLH